MKSKDQMWEYFTDQMREYFTTLFPDLGAGEQIHIRCLDTSGTSVAHAFFPTIDRAILFCLKHSGENHVYPAVNPRDKDKVKEEKASGRSRGGGKNTVSRVVTLWADYDLEKFGKSKEEGVEYLQNLSRPPSMTVFTGGGLQPYWILEKAARSAEDMARSERIINAFTLWWGIDKGVKDYSRVLRAPGTENIKYDPPRMCLIEQPDNGARYTLGELEAMIPSEYRSPQYSSSSRSHSGKGAGREHRNGSYPLATPEVPLGPNSNRHLRGTSVVGHYASHRTSSGRPVSEEWVKRQGELWFENPENCTHPLHLSDDPKEIEEWDRLVSDIYKKEQEKIKTSENGSGAEGGIVPSSHRPQYMSWDDLRDDHTSSSSIEATTPTRWGAVSLFELPPPGPTRWFVKGIFEAGLPVGFYGMSGALKPT